MVPEPKDFPAPKAGDKSKGGDDDEEDDDDSVVSSVAAPSTVASKASDVSIAHGKSSCERPLCT